MPHRPLNDDDWRTAARWRAIGVIIRDLIITAIVSGVIGYCWGAF